MIYSWLVLIFTLVNFPNSIFVHSVTLQAGAHLDLNVAVMVQKAFTGEGCRKEEEQKGKQIEMGQNKIDCDKRKCAQSVQYKVDLGYSNVRPTSVNGRPLDYPGGYSAFLAEKNRLSLELAKKVARLNNDAFQPFLYMEFERLIADFYNGHSRILGLFNISMEKLNNEEFSSENFTKNGIPVSPCVELAIFNESQQNLVEMLERNWQINWTRHNNNTNIRDLTFFELIKLRIPPSPIQLIECYNIAAQKQALINVSQKGDTNLTSTILFLHTNHLFRLLVHLSNGTRPFRSKINEKCRNVLNGIDQIIKNESLISRLLYNPMRSLFIRDLEAILSTKAARGQTGRYYENNMASIRFRFMSMTSIVMQESREYNNFNLLVDLGSTLGLYFGLTILTVFELFIFVFYRAGARDPTEVQTLPPQSQIYNIPPISGNRASVKKMTMTGGKLRQRRANTAIKEELLEDYSAPIPLPF